MKNDKTAVVAIAILIAGLLIGGTGGAIAAGTIGTGGIENGAVTTPKLANGAVTSPKIRNGTVSDRDLAASAEGAQLIQYVGDGGLIGPQNTAVVELPGNWNAKKVANSSWSVQLVRNGPPSFVFALGQSAPAGEGTGDGFYIEVDGGTASVRINAASYAVIDTIRVNRTVRTGSNGNTTVSRQVVRAGPAGG